MSMPSDVTEDVSEAMGRVDRPARPSRVSSFFARNPLRNVTAEQAGWAFASLVAFIGVAHLGPTLARMTRPETRAEMVCRKAIEARRRARSAGAAARKKMRRLGGGTIRR